MTSSTPEPTPPLTDDELTELREQYRGPYDEDFRRVLAEVDRLREENADLETRRLGWKIAAETGVDTINELRAELAEAPSRRDLLVAEEIMRAAQLGQHKAEADRDALAAKLDAVREIEPTLRRIYATGIASEHEVIDAVDELIGQALRESAATPPEGDR